MNAWLASFGSDAVDAVTDVVGILAVLAALVLLVVVETRRSTGRDRSRLLNRSALGVTVLALVIIGGRFQWIPAAGEGEGPGETAAAVSDPADTDPADTDPADTDPADTSTSTSASTSSPDTTMAGPRTSIFGPQAPSTEPPASSTTVVDDEDPAVPTSLVGPPAPASPTEPVEPPQPETPPADDDVDGSEGPRGPPSTYEVAAGDNFWTIAESVLEAETGGPVSDGEIHGYWLDLIDANADQLVEPGNPDLIVPGQLLDVPPVGGASP